MTGYESVPIWHRLLMGSSGRATWSTEHDYQRRYTAVPLPDFFLREGADVHRLSSICSKICSNLFLEFNAVHLLLNLTFGVIPFFPAPTKREVNGLGDVVRNYQYDVDTLGPPAPKRIRGPHFSV